jgi:hypothetical protein
MAAIARYGSDQVSAHLTFATMKDDKLTPKQRKWLEDSAKATLTRATQVLERDFDLAAASLDLRGALIAQSVAEKTTRQFTSERKAQLAALRAACYRAIQFKLRFGL